MAKDFGFDGIEIRGLGNEIFSVNAQPFKEENLPKTIEKLRSLGLEIPCLTSGACLKFKDKSDAVKEEITAYAELAGKLGASYIRVLGDLEPAPGGEVDDEYVADCLRQLAVEGRYRFFMYKFREAYGKNEIYL